MLFKNRPTVLHINYVGHHWVLLCPTKSNKTLDDNFDDYRVLIFYEATKPPLDGLFNMENFNLWLCTSLAAIKH